MKRLQTCGITMFLFANKKITIHYQAKQNKTHWWCVLPVWSEKREPSIPCDFDIHARYKGYEHKTTKPTQIVSGLSTQLILISEGFVGYDHFSSDNQLQHILCKL